LRKASGLLSHLSFKDLNQMAANTFKGFVRSFSLVAVCGFVGCGGDADNSTTAAPPQSAAATAANDAYVNSAGKDVMQSTTTGASKPAAKPAEVKAEPKADAKPAADAPK
jgi:hypothetical protein